MPPQIPAKVFAAVYLLMIPFYGVIYMFLPKSFYHSTVAYEASIKRDNLRIGYDIKDAIVSGIQAHYGSDIATVGNARVNAASIRVNDVRAKDGQLTFDLYCEEARKNVSFGFSVSLLLLPTSPASSTGEREVMLLAEPREVAPFGFKLLNLCPGIHNHPQGTWGADVQGFLVLTRDVQRRIRGYMDAQEGFPSSASGSFLRMLYFSAITITTVGYGDIVPITGFARFLVGSEAILGVVMIGFFLNAVARGSR